MPVPGGPYRTIECGRPSSIADRSADPSPSRCSCPTNSSSVSGRIRAASGWSAWGTRVCPRGASSPVSKSWSFIRDRMSRSHQNADRMTRINPRFYSLVRARGRAARTPHHRAAPAADPLQHGQPARQRAGRAGAPAARRSRPPASSASCSRAVEGRPNLVARLRGDGDGPTLCLCGHVDTVLADPGDWSVDPWSGELKDGCVWGRGALDMKSQVAAEVAAAASLAEEGWRPAGELLVVITADEEAGAEYGAQWLCDRARRQGPLRLHGQRGRGRGPPLRRPPRLRGLRRREGRLPLHAHHRGRGGPRVDPAASATTRSRSSRRCSRRCATASRRSSSARSPSRS